MIDNLTDEELHCLSWLTRWAVNHFKVESDTMSILERINIKVEKYACQRFEERYPSQDAK